jgi:hypothetical protein
MSNGEPTVYVAEHVKEILLHDPEVGELDIHVCVEGPLVVVTGNVSTVDRHEAITRRLAELLPDHDVRNETTVTVYPEAPSSQVGT